MKNRFFKCCWLILVFTTMAIPTWGASSPDELLQQGLADFKAGRYMDAVANLELLTDIKNNNPYLDAALYLTAKTHIRLRQYILAEDAIIELKQSCPRSGYIDYADYLLAEIHYVQKKDLRAYGELFELYTSCYAPELRMLVEAKLNLLLNSLKIEDLLLLRKRLPGEGREFINELIKRKGIPYTIVVLVSPQDTLAKQYIEGMQLALDIYEQGVGKNKIGLQVVQTQEDLLEQYLLVRNFDLQPVCAIIDLETGTRSLINATAACNLQIPFFILKDNTPNMSLVGSNVWQLQPDLFTMGEALAEFAVNNMGLKRMVTLATLNDSRVHFAEAFIERLKELEVDIAGQEWYYAQALDLGKNFKSLRRIGFRYAFDDSLMTLLENDSLLLPVEDWALVPDSLVIPVDSMYFTVDTLDEALLDELWKDYQDKMRELARFRRVEIDSNDIKLDCFGGFIFPLVEDEVDMYVPQFAFYNFKTNLMSLLSAFPPAKLENHKQHLTGMKVVGWGRVDRNSEAFTELTDRFYALKGSAPTDEEVLGYDTMNMALNFIRLSDERELAFHKDELVFKGINYDFTFPPGKRNNHSVNFFEFNGRYFQELKIPVSDSTSVNTGN